MDCQGDRIDFGRQLEGERAAGYSPLRELFCQLDEITAAMITEDRCRKHRCFHPGTKAGEEDGK